MDVNLTQHSTEEHLSDSELATLQRMAEVDPVDALKAFSVLPESLKAELRTAMKQWPVAVRKTLKQSAETAKRTPQLIEDGHSEAERGNESATPATEKQAPAVASAIAFLERCLIESIPIKGLTLHRPWAHAIAFLGKDIENRTWRCPSKVGDWVAIHSGQKIDDEGMHWIFQNTGVAVDGDLPGIVAIARFAGNRQPSESGRSIWHREGQIGWHFDQVIPILPIVEHRGQTSLWNVETRAVETILNVLIGTRQKSGVGKSTVRAKASLAK